jgi:hypothetical protein
MTTAGIVCTMVGFAARRLMAPEPANRIGARHGVRVPAHWLIRPHGCGVPRWAGRPFLGLSASAWRDSAARPSRCALADRLRRKWAKPVAMTEEAACLAALAPMQHRAGPHPANSLLCRKEEAARRPRLRARPPRRRTGHHRRAAFGSRHAGSPAGLPVNAAPAELCRRSGYCVLECGCRSLAPNRWLSQAPRMLGGCAGLLCRLFRDWRAGASLCLPRCRRPASALADSVGPRRETIDEPLTMPDLDTDRPRNHPAGAFACVIIAVEALDEVIVRHSRGIEQTEAISWHTSAPLLPATAPDRCTCQANKNAVAACSLYRRGCKAFFSTMFQGIVCHMGCHFCKEKSVAKVLTFSIGKPR